jgi:carnitine O-acetyltransferase
MRDRGKTNEEKKVLFMATVKRHINYAKDVGSATGIDRHLLGVRMLVDESDGGRSLA